MSAAILYLVVVAIWAGVLVPRWIQRDGATGKTANKINKPSPTLEQMFTDLSKSLNKSAYIVARVTAELDLRKAMALRLKQEAEDAEALAAQNKEQVDAIRRLLRSEMVDELSKTQRGILYDSIKLTIASFIAGAAASVAVTLLIH